MVAVVAVAGLECLAGGLRIHGVGLARRRAVGGRRIVHALGIVIVRGIRRGPGHPASPVHRLHSPLPAASGVDTSEHTVSKPGQENR